MPQPTMAMQGATSPSLSLRVCNRAVRPADPCPGGRGRGTAESLQRKPGICTTCRPWPQPATSCSGCLLLAGLAGSAGGPAQRIPRAGRFSFFLFCQTECEFASGTSQAKRRCFGLLVSTGGRSTPLPYPWVPNCVTQGRASIWSDQSTKTVPLPVGQAVEIPNLLSLPKVQQLTWSSDQVLSGCFRTVKQ